MDNIYLVNRAEKRPFHPLFENKPERKRRSLGGSALFFGDLGSGIGDRCDGGGRRK